MANPGSLKIGDKVTHESWKGSVREVTCLFPFHREEISAKGRRKLVPDHGHLFAQLNEDAGPPDDIDAWDDAWAEAGLEIVDA